MRGAGFAPTVQAYTSYMDACVKANTKSSIAKAFQVRRLLVFYRPAHSCHGLLGAFTGWHKSNRAQAAPTAQHPIPLGSIPKLEKFDLAFSLAEAALWVCKLNVVI